MDDSRLTTDDSALATDAVPQHTGNRTLAIWGYLLFIGGFLDMWVAFLMMLTTKPHFVGQGWAGLWFVAVTIVGSALMFPNIKTLRIPTKGWRLFGQAFAQFGILLSGGFVLWLIDTSWGGWWLGVALLVGSVALFTVGMLIALDKNAVDISG